MDNSTHINLQEKIKLHKVALFCTVGSLDAKQGRP